MASGGSFGSFGSFRGRRLAPIDEPNMVEARRARKKQPALLKRRAEPEPEPEPEPDSDPDASEPDAASELDVDGVSHDEATVDEEPNLDGAAQSVVMEEEFDRQQPGLPGIMTAETRAATHGKLLARSARWEGSDAPSAAQLRMIEQVIDARLQAQYATKIAQVELEAQARIGKSLAVRAGTPLGFHQAMLFTGLAEGKAWSTRAAAWALGATLVLLALVMVQALTHSVAVPSCASNAQCESFGGAGRSYCNPADARQQPSRCVFCAEATAHTGTADALRFCADPRTADHPACLACAGGDDGYGQWRVVETGALGELGAGGGWSAAGGNTTWGSSSELSVATRSVDSMRSADVLSLFLAAGVLACVLAAEIRDVKLCESSLCGRKGGTFSAQWRRAFYGLGVLRQYALIPAVARTLPLLTLLSGGDSRSVIAHTIPAMFVLHLSSVVFECGLPRSIRVAAEELGRVDSKLTREDGGGMEIARGGTMLLVRFHINFCTHSETNSRLFAGFIGSMFSVQYAGTDVHSDGAAGGAQRDGWCVARFGTAPAADFCGDGGAIPCEPGMWGVSTQAIDLVVPGMFMRGWLCFAGCKERGWT